VLDSNQSVLQIPLILPDQSTQILFDLVLPTNFPTGRPKLFVKSQIEPRSTRYISDEGGEVRHPKLDRWGVNCSLDGVIYAIMSDLVRENTIKVRERNSSANRNVSPYGQSGPNQSPSAFSGNGMASVAPSQRESHPPKEPEQIHFPPIPDHFEQLNSMNQVQLQELLDHEFKFDQFVQNLDYVKNISALVSDMEKENLSIAKDKVAKDKMLNERVEQLNKKKEELSRLNEQYQQLLADKKKIDEKYEPHHVLAKLEDIIEESEQHSEAVVDEFMVSGDVSQFIKKFVDTRSRYHMRKLKRDRFAVQHIGNAA